MLLLVSGFNFEYESQDLNTYITSVKNHCWEAYRKNNLTKQELAESFTVADINVLVTILERLEARLHAGIYKAVLNALYSMGPRVKLMYKQALSDSTRLQRHFNFHKLNMAKKAKELKMWREPVRKYMLSLS